MNKDHWIGASVVALAAFLGGCAVGNTHSYGDAPLNLAVAASSPVAVAVQDTRPYVLSGNKKEGFVGLSRGGYGNPFDVSTQSGGPLATEMRDGVVKALRGKGVTVSAVTISPRDTPSGVRKALSDTGANKSLLVTLREWKSDTYMSTALHFDVTLAVLDRKGETLAQNSLKGVDNLGTLGFSAETGVSSAFVKKFELLFSDPRIAAALK